MSISFVSKVTCLKTQARKEIKEKKQQLKKKKYAPRWAGQGLCPSVVDHSAAWPAECTDADFPRRSHGSEAEREKTNRMRQPQVAANLTARFFFRDFLVCKLKGKTEN